MSGTRILLGIPVPCIEIDAVRAACFLQQIMNMKFHSALGNEQVLGNLGIGLFLQGKTQNRAFPHGQLILTGEILELFLRCSLSKKSLLKELLPEIFLLMVSLPKKPLL